MTGLAALTWLLRAKFRGTLRKQVRRLRTPRGIVFALLGAFVFGSWILSLVFGASLRGEFEPNRGDPLPVQVFSTLFVALALSGAFTHRGIYFPRDEIERLLSAPLLRSDIVRYRMLVSMGKGLISGLVVALLLMRRMSNPLYAFLGVMLGMCTLPILQQGASLTLGAIEVRFGRFARGGAWRVLQALLGMAVGGMFVMLVLGDGVEEEFPTLAEASTWLGSPRHPPLVRALLLPLKPWALAITATEPGTFLRGIGLALAIAIALFELTARLPFDYRELSLDTSADIARRIRQASGGGLGASAGKAVRGKLGRRIPWLFGRGPLGAVAWVKLASIQRKARGTLTFSLFILALILVGTVAALPDDEDASKAVLFLAGLGTVYLCGGLRFDFRSDIDRLEAMKGWPIPTWRTFLGNLLPEIVLVSLLIVGALLVQGVVLGRLDWTVPLVAAVVPLFTTSWVALDNAVFLFAPSRPLAGQEGMLQHMGRSMILLFLRGVLGLAVLGIVALVAVGVMALAREFDVGDDGAKASALAAVLLTFLGITAVLVRLGGHALHKLDVSSLPR